MDARDESTPPGDDLEKLLGPKAPAPLPISAAGGDGVEERCPRSARYAPRRSGLGPLPRPQDLDRFTAG